MSSAVIYCRISRDREGTEVGTENQEAAGRELAALHGLDVAHVYIDNDRGASTRSRKTRPQYAAMLAAAKRGEFSTVIAYSNSRLTRRPREFEDLIELHEAHGIRYLTKVSGNDDLSTADGRMVARIKAASDAAEAERTGERVAFAHAAKRAKGEDTGGPRPFGFEEDRVTIRDREAALIRLGVEMVTEEGASMYAVARAWDASGVRAQKWRSQTVRDILIRPRNTGRLVVAGVDYGTAGREAIITDEQHRELLTTLSANAKPNRGPKPQTSSAVTIVKCGACGAGVELTMNGTGRILRCSKRGGGIVHPTAQDHDMERWLAEFALMEVTDPTAEGGTDREHVATLRRTLSAVTAQRERARSDVEAYEDEADREYARQRVAVLSAEVRAAQSAIDAALADDVASRARHLVQEAHHVIGGEIVGVDAVRVWPQWWTLWQSWPVADRRELLRGHHIELLRANEIPRGANRLRIDGRNNA
jgi:DNA invertase Pin-like site-specific DNA recombinase